MKNIYLLPTDKPSRLYIDNKGKYNLEIGQVDFKTFQNIYITSDEQVKEGDYYVSLILDGKKIWKTTKIDCITKADLNKTNEYLVEPFSKYCKKIVLTTDTQLIKDGVQEIGDEFLEWFVQNPSCENVEVEIDYFMWRDGTTKLDDFFKIIIPKKEQKKHIIDMMEKDEELGLYDETEHLLSNKANKERLLEDVFNDEKRQGVKELIDKHKQDDENYLDSFGVTKTQFEVYRNFNKQKTLEEVLGSSMCQFSVIENKLATLYRNQVKIYDAITKEQKTYSEEDMEAAFYSDAKEWMSFKEWVKQF